MPVAAFRNHLWSVVGGPSSGGDLRHDRTVKLFKIQHSKARLISITNKNRPIVARWNEVKWTCCRQVHPRDSMDSSGIRHIENRNSFPSDSFNVEEGSSIPSAARAA
jgi:hypothetical protein